MDDNRLELLEQRLGQGSSSAPAALRDEVLSQVERELLAARWDRRLTRTAGALLIAGISLNLLMGLHHDRLPHASTTVAENQDAYVRTAVAIAETTDAEMGRSFIRQLEFINGWTLDAKQTAAIDAAAKRRNSPSRL